MNYDLEFGLVQEHDEFDLSITYLQTLGPNLFESIFGFLQAVYVLKYINSSIIRPRVCGLYLKEVNIKEHVIMEVVRGTYFSLIKTQKISNTSDCF